MVCKRKVQSKIVPGVKRTSSPNVNDHLDSECVTYRLQLHVVLLLYAAVKVGLAEGLRYSDINAEDRSCGSVVPG